MAIVQNGRSPVAIKWIDPDGVEHAIVQAWLGERLVFDGTMPALVQVTDTQAIGEVYPPTISAGQTIAVPHIAGVGETPVPKIVAGARLLPSSATAAGEVFAPIVSAAANVQAVTATGDGGVVNIPSVGVTAEGEVIVEIATGTGEVYAPTVMVPGTVQATMATGTSETFIPAVRGSANVYAPNATGAGQVHFGVPPEPALYPGEDLYPSDTLHPSDGTQPLVRAGANVAVPTADASGSVPTPGIPVYGTVRPPVASGSGSVNIPVVTSTPNPQRMNKSGVQAISNGVWTKATGMVADPAYPATNIVTSGLVVSGSGTMVVHAQSTFGGAGTTAQTKGCRVLLNGVVVATFTGTASSAVWGGTQSVALNHGDRLDLEVIHGSSTASSRELQATGTYLYFDTV